MTYPIHDHDEPDMVIVVLPRVDEMPVLPDSTCMGKRLCSTCGTSVWFEPVPDVPEWRCTLLCARCAPPSMAEPEYHYLDDKERLKLFAEMTGREQATPKELDHFFMGLFHGSSGPEIKDTNEHG